MPDRDPDELERIEALLRDLAKAAIDEGFDDLAEALSKALQQCHYEYDISTKIPGIDD